MSSNASFPKQWMVVMFNHIIVYMSQVDAIRNMFTRHLKDDQTLEKKIETVKLTAEQSFGIRNEIAVADLADLYHESACQDAVHSAAAVGALAPLFESFFTNAFCEMGEYIESNESLIQERKKYLQKNGSDCTWDCHFFLTNKKRKQKNVVLGIKQLIEACGMGNFMPSQLNETLGALFAYRNNMFHWGFKWPQRIRDGFNKRLRNWPRGWFEQMSCDGKPEEFYMSKLFIDHCIETIDQVIGGFVEYAKCKTQEDQSKE